MVAHRTLTPFVRVRILHPLPKQFIGFDELLFLLAAWHQNPNKTNQISARSAEGASRVRILYPLPKQFTGFDELLFLLWIAFSTRGIPGGNCLVARFKPYAIILGYACRRRTVGQMKLIRLCACLISALSLRRSRRSERWVNTWFRCLSALHRAYGDMHFAYLVIPYSVG